MKNNISYSIDLPRIVLFEKVHPFVKTIVNSLKQDFMPLEIYYYKNDFIIYQESSIAGAKVYWKDIVLSRAMYFSMEDLKTLEKSAINPGIIKRADWNSLVMSARTYYIFNLKSYLFTTGLLFMHKNGKADMVNSLILEKQFCDKFVLKSEKKSYSDDMPTRLLSNDLPVRKCFTEFNVTKGSNIVFRILTCNEKDKVYMHEKFKRDIDFWLNGNKNSMLNWEKDLSTPPLVDVNHTF